MKLRKWLPAKFRRQLRRLNQKGQSLVEFVLLLAVVSGISYGFVAIMNQNIGNYWTYAVNLVIHDRPGETTAQLD